MFYSVKKINVLFSKKITAEAVIICQHQREDAEAHPGADELNSLFFGYNSSCTKMTTI
jgi:hypothetical protein